MKIIENWWKMILNNVYRGNKPYFFIESRIISIIFKKFQEIIV